MTQVIQEPKSRLKKTNQLIVAILLILALSSCITQKASVKSSKDLTDGVKEVVPEWSPDTKGQWILPVLGLAGGAAYGYEAEPISPEINQGAENAAVYGLMGGFGGMILSAVVVSTQRKKKKKLIVQSQDYNKWVRKFNRDLKGEKYYLFDKVNDGKLLLASTYSRKQIDSHLSALEKAEKELQNDIEEWRDFAKYDRIVNSEYSKLFPQETNALKLKIVNKKSTFSYERIIGDLNQIINLPSSLSKAKKLSEFKRSSTYMNFSNNLSSDQYSIINGEIQTSMNETLKIIAITDKIEIDNWDNSLSSLKRAENWYTSFKEKYNLFYGSSEYTSMISHLKRKVNTIYRSNQDILKGEFHKLTSSEQVNLLTKNLKVDIEGFNQGFSIVNSIASNRKKELLVEFGFDNRTESLSNGKFIKQILIGDSKSLSFNASSMDFNLIIKQFMYESAKICTDLDDVQMIYSQECKTERITKNGWGVEISRYCVEYIDVPTGFYTSKALYQAYKRVQRTVDQNALGNAFKVLAAWGSGLTTEGAFEVYPHSVQSDMQKFIRYHGCSSRVLKRFEQNLILFANGKEMLKI